MTTTIKMNQVGNDGKLFEIKVEHTGKQSSRFIRVYSPKDVQETTASNLAIINSYRAACPEEKYMTFGLNGVLGFIPLKGEEITEQDIIKHLIR